MPSIEFECQWTSWIVDNLLASNRWSNDIYTLRFNWCLVYLSNYFFVGMTQLRDERMNNNVKMKIKLHYMLLEFVCNFELVLNDMWQKKIMLNHHNYFLLPAFISCLPNEHSLFGVYTSKAFFVYQEGMLNSMRCVIRIVSEIKFDIFFFP